MICKICGKEFNAANHIKKQHNLTSQEYYDIYIGTPGKCKMCGKPTVFKGLKQGYKTYCSVKCAQNDIDIRQKVSSTTKSNLLSKYGVENVQQIKSVREKTKQTCLKRYGNSYAIAAESTKQKISVIQKSKLKEYDDLIKTGKVMDIYGTGWYQTNVRKTLGIEIVMKGRYGYVKKSDLPKIDAYMHSDLRHSKTEVQLYEFIKSIYNKEILHNSKKIITPYELDFYLPDLKLGIEYNSTYYHSTEKDCKIDYHLNKSLLCRSKGIRLIHIYEFENLDEQKQLLKDLILGNDNYPKNDFNKNNLIKNIPEPTIIYKDNTHTIYGAGPLY